jgi:cardiolipin synthase A/B
LTFRQGALLIGVTLLGLAPVSCARVQSHFTLPDLAVADPSFLPTMEAYTSPAVGGNTAALLLNGDQIFPAQLDAIRSARKTITYAQYYYEEGPIGREIAEALADRCRAGVRAYILLDGFGTLLMPAAYRETMERAGCVVATFRPLSPFSLLAAFRVGSDNKRNHRRILVVDGRVGFTGGSGISPKWAGDGRTEGHWRETDVRIEGPVVALLQGAFVENWLEATGDVLGGESYFPQLSPRGSVSAQIVRSSPTGGGRAGGGIVEVPIKFADRERGRSKMSFRIVVEALLLVTWWGVSDLPSRRRALRRPGQARSTIKARPTTL